MEISRSEQKRRIKRIEALVIELSQLPGSVVEDLPCIEEVKVLLRKVSGLKAGTKKRQIKYITKLLKNEPLEGLYDLISSRKGSALQEKKHFHEIEFLRDSLLSEALKYREHCQEIGQEIEEKWPSKVVEEIEGLFPHVDTFSLIRLAIGYAITRNRKHKREIFRLLSAASEQQQYERRKDGAKEKINEKDKSRE